MYLIIVFTLFIVKNMLDKLAGHVLYQTFNCKLFYSLCSCGLNKLHQGKLNKHKILMFSNSINYNS